MVVILGKDLPLLAKDTDGTIYLKTRREDKSKHKYMINSYLLADIIIIMNYIISNEPEPLYFTKFEYPALAYYIRHGFYGKKEPISATKARQLARFIKDVFNLVLLDVLKFNEVELETLDKNKAKTHV